LSPTREDREEREHPLSLAVTGRGAQAERARERAAAMAVAARKEELEAVLSSNLRRRRDELRQALAEADAGAARCAGGRRWHLASLIPHLLQGETGPCEAGWQRPASQRRMHLCRPQRVRLLAEAQREPRGTGPGDAARPPGCDRQGSLAARRAALEAASAQAAAAAERVRGAEAAEAEAEAALEAGAARLRELAAQAERLRELEARGALGVQARARPVAAGVHGRGWHRTACKRARRMRAACTWDSGSPRGRHLPGMRMCSYARPRNYALALPVHTWTGACGR